ncbi:MAG: integrase [Sphingopyxis macrogoltabida]|uniref:Integrase n=1 Tax=Sphingopyxis macrogoltabida TaxID=33050 RepID=A0A2W5N6X1_SPHMC|nr:MAG: integrase [Sphingopyxis macrogoltabida]
MASSPQRYDDLPIEVIEDALFSIPADLSREKWWRIGAALKSELGEQGKGLFHDWSRGASNYNERDCEDTWKSTSAGGGIGIATLIYEAQQNGFTFGEGRARLDAEQVEQRRRDREAAQKQAEAEKRRNQADAAKRANMLWDASARAGDDHPYLVAKGVRAHGLAVGEWPIIGDDGEVSRTITGALLIPIADAKNGRIVSMQAIMDDRRHGFWKSYLKHGRKRGGFHMIGTTPAAGQPLAFAEGYATGAKIHELTGWAVVIVFDAPNMPVVAAVMREQFPRAAFLICADNDRWSKVGDIENPGLHYAGQAADATRGFVLAPRFESDEGKPTDWADLAEREGEAVARAQLLANPVTSAPPTDVAGVEAKPPAVNDNIDYFTPLPDVGGKGKPLATIENYAEILDRLNVTVRYNVIKKALETNIPGEQFLIDNADNNAIARLESECCKFGMSTDKVGAYHAYLGDKHPRNPVADWIAGKPWDGTPRLQSLLDTVTAANDRKLPDGRSLRDVLMTRWLVSAVAAAFEPMGVSARGILVFQGEQYLGKTMWIKQLVPADELPDVVQDGVLLNPADKDSVRHAVSYWIVELGELDATFRKADLAALKAFIPKQMDKLRLPYARTESQFARKTIFFGSVNPRSFLHDPTGNSRYWTIECAAIDLEAQRALDMQQVWAEVRALYDAGEPYRLTAEEMAGLNDHNEEYQAVDPIEERVQVKLGWGEPLAMWRWKTATEILLEIGVDKPTSADATKVGTIVRRLNGERARKSNGKRQMLVPAKVNGVGRNDFGGDDFDPFDKPF